MKSFIRSCIASLLALVLMAVVTTPCFADVIDPDTGEYGGPALLEPEPEVDPDPEQETVSDAEEESSFPLLAVGVAVALAAAGATAAIVFLGKGKRDVA